MDNDRFEYLEIGKPAPRAAERTTPMGPPTLKAAQLIGGPGRELGQFNTPCGLAVDGYGNLYVADTNNHRVQLISPEGDVYGIGLPPGAEGAGALCTPIDVAVDNLLSVYVLECNPGRITKFNAQGRFMRQFSAAGQQVGFLDQPRRMHRDDLGRLYVADTGNGRVQIFDSTGDFIDVFGGIAARGNVGQPQAVATDGEHNVWVADGAESRLLRFNSAGGRTGGLGRAGTALGEFGDPTGLVVTREGLVIVAEHGNARVSVLRLDGTPVAAYQSSGQTARLDGPQGVAWSASEGAVYVSDTVNHRVLKLLFGG